MFSTAKRTFLLLLRTPIVPPPPAPPAFELMPFSKPHAAGPSRPRASSRTISPLSLGNGYQLRTYASDFGKKELYSDEAGSSGAGTDDVAHTDAAFNNDPNPSSAAKGVEEETGKDFTARSPANPAASHPPGEQGETDGDAPMRTSRKEAGKRDRV